jgi:hypothetical protein
MYREYFELRQESVNRVAIIRHGDRWFGWNYWGNYEGAIQSPGWAFRVSKVLSDVAFQDGDNNTWQLLWTPS